MPPDATGLSVGPRPGGSPSLPAGQGEGVSGKKSSQGWEEERELAPHP